MLIDIGAPAIKDFIGLLKNEKDFFSPDQEKRRQLIVKHLGDSYPKAFQDYLSKTSADRFLKEVKHALDVFQKSAYADPQNELLNAFAYYLSEDFGHRFDQLTIAFFFAPYLERIALLEKLFPGQSALNRAVRDFILRSTYQEISMALYGALSYLKDIPTIVIQTPVELESQIRMAIRDHIIKKHPFAFPEFQVNPQIIGGMRIFVGGKVVDESWMGRIQSLANLTHLI